MIRFSSRSRSSSPHRKISESFHEKNAAELIQSLADAHAAQQGNWGVVVNPLGNLKRTATAVLTQLEKSLVAPPQAAQSAYFDIENAREFNIPDSSKSKKH
jgi:hypothetical protein